jgi:hypothetical protein
MRHVAQFTVRISKVIIFFFKHIYLLFLKMIIKNMQFLVYYPKNIIIVHF